MPIKLNKLIHKLLKTKNLKHCSTKSFENKNNQANIFLINWIKEYFGQKSRGKGSFLNQNIKKKSL